jgi:hypothetical protein
VQDAVNGTVALVGGNVVFTPSADYNGPASFTYTVSDGQGGTDTATVNVTVTPVNDAPVASDDNATQAADDALTTAEDTALTIAPAVLLANDSDIDGGTLALASVQDAVNGTVALVGGNVVFTPSADYNGPASFTYTVSDGQGGTDTATVNVTVTPVNDAPVASDDNATQAADDALTTAEDTALTIAPAVLLANDSDIDGGTLALASVQDAVNGTVALVGGNVVFTPSADYNGPASFTYTVSDGQGGTDTATVNVTVTPLNDAPVAVDDAASTDEDTPLTGTVALVANDTDLDGDRLSVAPASVGSFTTTQGGTIVVAADGNYTYTPAANFNGTDTFDYTVTDGELTDVGRLTITVNGVNKPPSLVLDSDTKSVHEEGLSGGTDSAATSEYAHGSFTVADPDGLADVKSITIGGTTFQIGNAPGEFGSLAALVSQEVTTGYGTLTLTGYANGSFEYEYRLDVAVDNDSQSGATGEYYVEQIQIGVSDGTLSASNTINVSIGDDAPRAFLATPGQLIDQEPYTRTLTSSLNFSASSGADGADEVWFSGYANGGSAADAHGNSLSFNGESLSWFIASPNVLEAKTAGGDVGIRVVVDAASDTYTLTTYGVITNGTQLSTVNLNGVGGGNPALKALMNIGGSSGDVIMSTKASDSINTNANEIGISEGNSFTAGELIRYDFVNGAQVVGNGKNASIAYDGSHNFVTEFRQKISVAGGTVNLTISAILADADNIFYGDGTGESVLALNVGNIRVFDVSGANVTSQVTLVDNGDSVTIQGMVEGWTFAVASATPFSALQVEAAGDTSDFKLGFFSLVQTVPGLPIDLAFNLTGSDADGDTATGSLTASLYPASRSIEGDGSDNALSGTPGTDYIFGFDGNDTLAGGAGNDVLIGGAGNDVLTGGAGNDALFGGLGADVFRWSLGDQGTAASPATDVVKDFRFAEGDALDLRDILGSNAENVEQYLQVSEVGANTELRVSTDGPLGAGGSGAEQVIVLENVTGLYEAGLTTQADIIHDLVNKNVLIID